MNKEVHTICFQAKIPSKKRRIILEFFAISLRKVMLEKGFSKCGWFLNLSIMNYFLALINQPLWQLIIQVILFEINYAIFYTNLHELFCQFIRWTNWVNSGKFMDNCWISCQVMADMKKVYDDLIIINLYIAVTRNNLYIIWIALVFTVVTLGLVIPVRPMAVNNIF